MNLCRNEQETFLDKPSGLGPGRPGHFGSAGSVCGDDEGEAVDARHLESGRRHGGRRRGVPGGNIQFRPLADRKNRLHQRCRLVGAEGLLPEAGTNIKGHMRSYEELLEASGYAGRPQEFEELLRHSRR